MSLINQKLRRHRWIAASQKQEDSFQQAAKENQPQGKRKAAVMKKAQPKNSGMYGPFLICSRREPSLGNLKALAEADDDDCSDIVVIVEDRIGG